VKEATKVSRVKNKGCLTFAARIGLGRVCGGDCVDVSESGS